MQKKKKKKNHTHTQINKYYVAVNIFFLFKSRTDIHVDSLTICSMSSYFVGFRETA